MHDITHLYRQYAIEQQLNSDGHWHNDTNGHSSSYNHDNTSILPASSNDKKRLSISSDSSNSKSSSNDSQGKRSTGR